MIVKHAFDVEMGNPEDDPTLNDMSATSPQIFGIEVLDTSIEDVRSKKKTMVSKIDSVISLMKEVEYEEKAAEQAKKEAALSHSDTMLKVYELMDMQQHVKKQNEMIAREAYVQKKLLSTEMEGLQLHVASLLDKGDKSLELLDEMSRPLEMRLASAIRKKKLALKKKKGNEAYAKAALAYQETMMGKVEEESKRLKQEAVEIARLQEFLIDRGHLVVMLHGELSDKCQDVKRLKEELDQVLPPGGKISLSRKSSISASSSTSSGSSIIPCQPQPVSAECDELFKKGPGNFVDDLVQSANYKKMKSVIQFYEADVKSPHEVADSTRGNEKVKIKGKMYGYHMKIKGKACASQVFAKCIKKVKIKGKQHAYQIFAKSIKKVKIKSKLQRNEMFAKGIKKVTMKRKLHGNKKCARSFKKLNLKGISHGSQMCAKSIKKLKMKGKRHGSQMCARSLKKLKIKGKQPESDMCAKSIEKMKIKSKPRGNQLCPKRIKKVKIIGKQEGCQICAINMKKVKIKGRRAA